MKNFSEALDTSTDLEVVVVLKVIKENGEPFFKVETINGIVYQGKLTGDRIMRFYIPGNNKFYVAFSLGDKIYSEKKETAVILESMTIAGRNVLPKFIDDMVYTNDQKKQLCTNYMGYNGTLKFDKTENFHAWYHGKSGQGMLISP